MNSFNSYHDPMSQILLFCQKQLFIIIPDACAWQGARFSLCTCGSRRTTLWNCSGDWTQVVRLSGKLLYLLSQPSCQSVYFLPFSSHSLYSLLSPFLPPSLFPSNIFFEISLSMLHERCWSANENIFTSFVIWKPLIFFCLTASAKGSCIILITSGVNMHLGLHPDLILPLVLLL